MLKGATYYDPAGATSLDPNATAQANQKRALGQMQDTLDKMVKYGHLSPAERAKYRTLPHWQNPRSNSRLSGQIGYLVDLAKSYLINNSDKTHVTADDLQKGGYRIYTTFDKKKVNALEAAVKRVRDANIKPKQRPDTDTYVQFGGASVDPTSGAIKAIYGGEDATKHFTDNADSTGAQVGSTFKPFVLAAAMKWGVRDPHGPENQGPDQRTIASPKSLYSGKNKLKIEKYDHTVWTDKDGKEWLQTNDGDDNVGNPPDYKIDLREAMQFSVNSAYVQLGMDVGLDKVKQSALDAGVLESSLASANYPSFSIGTSDPSAIRMAGAYGTFAASGKQNDPYSVDRSRTRTGSSSRTRRRRRTPSTRTWRTTSPTSCGPWSTRARVPAPGCPDARWRARPVPPTATSRPGSSATPRSCPPRSACSAWTTTRTTSSGRSWRCTERAARRRSTVPRSRRRSGTTTWPRRSRASRR